jgi:hypothetical protein
VQPGGKCISRAGDPGDFQDALSGARLALHVQATVRQIDERFYVSTTPGRVKYAIFRRVEYRARHP